MAKNIISSLIAVVVWNLFFLPVPVGGQTEPENSTETLAAPQSGSLWTRSRGDDWPSFLGPTGDGKSTEHGILKDWSQGNLKVVWKANAGEGYGIGAVAEGRFYHFDRWGGEAVLSCLAAETGKPLWKFSYASNYQDLYDYSNGPRASPIVDEGRVFIYGVEGMLHCLDAVTGQLVWKLDTQTRFGVIQNFFGVASTPLIVDDLLLVAVGGSPDDSQSVPPGALDQVKADGTGLIAINKATGEIKYACANDLASYASLKLAKFNGQPLVLAWLRGSLFGIRPGTGEIQFEFPWRSRKLESVNASMPVVVGNQVLISECYGMGSALLEIGTGPPKLLRSDQGKREKSLEAHWNTPIVLGDCVFGCSGRHSGPAELRCVDWKTGRVNWSQPGLSRTTLTYIDGHFVVLGEQGVLQLIQADPDEFHLVTEYQPGPDGVDFESPCWAAPIVSHGLLYVRGKKQLVCFDLIPEQRGEDR